MKREDYLHKKIQPYNPSKASTVEDALIGLQGCSFQGRNLGNALEVLTNMVKEPHTLRVLTLSGAMIPAGMEEIICQAIEKKIIGAIVSTGANIIHSIVNSFTSGEQAHYIGRVEVDDTELYSYQINRIYDTYIPEKDYRDAEGKIRDMVLALYPTDQQLIIAPSKLFHDIGTQLPSRNFLKVASENNVPIFCGATSDSELALDLMKFRIYDKLQIFLDEMGDVENFARLIQQYETHGTIILGGGVPRNWAQQVFPYLEQTLPQEKKGHFHGYKYSVRFHSAFPQDGGLSGCTISESISWGKYTTDALNQSVWGDSTVYFPLIMTALFQRIQRMNLNIA